jgi:stress response protein SCP2
VSFGFRVGVPGMGIRVSTRGVRASVGPRIARVHVGTGRTRVSSGLGPFFASTTLSSGRRRTTTRRAPRARAAGPSAAQLERARRAAERAQQEAERDARIAELHELRRQSTSVHLQAFPAAHPPVVPLPPSLGLPWASAEAEAFHLRGIGRFARSQRSAARARGTRDAPAYLAAERTRLLEVHRELAEQAASWWRDLLDNDEETVCEAVNAAFADNPAAGCAVGLCEGVLSVVMRQQDIETLPDRTPGTTPNGRPTLKALTKRDRAQWWLTILGSNLIATVKEALATAPGITAVELAVLSRLPDTHRLGVVAYGRWTRRAIESIEWRAAEDALRFLELGEDVACEVSTSPPRVRAVDVSAIPGLQSLIDHAIDDGLDDEPDDPAPAPPNPYAITPFDQWATGSPQPPSPPPPPQPLVPGQNLVLPEDAASDLTLALSFAGADADLSLLLLDRNRRVRTDDDFVFYNQPVGAEGAARLLGKGPGDRAERASLRLNALPPDVARVAVSVNMDVAAGLTCAALDEAVLQITGPTATFTIPTPPDPRIRAMVLVEIYRHAVGGQQVWKLRAVGQGWADGLAGLARDHGVDVV